jgi:hypothetical protein
MARNIPESIAAVEFDDIEQVILAGSGVQELAGELIGADIDLVSPETNTHELLTRRPPLRRLWTEKTNVFTRSDGTTFEMLSIEDSEKEFDIWPQWYDASRPQGDRLVSFDELKEDTWQHPLGFFVVSMRRHLAMKAALNRPKDRRHLARHVQFTENGY